MPIHIYLSIYAYPYLSIYLSIYLFMDWPIVIVGGEFANGLGAWGAIPGQVITETQKILLDTSLLNS